MVDTHWHLKIQCLVCLHALHSRIVQVINIRLHELSQTLVPTLLLAIYRYSMAGVDHIFLITSPGQGRSRTCHHQSDSTTDTCNRRHSTFQFCMCVWHTQNWELLPITHSLLILILSLEESKNFFYGQQMQNFLKYARNSAPQFFWPW